MAANLQTIGAVEILLCSTGNLAYARPMDSAPDDSALMLRYRDGDVQAFEILYRRHNDALFRYLLRLCRNRATAEDVFQDAWSKIVRARENYRPTARFTTFLYRVAHNCFIDNVRRSRRHDATVDAEPDNQPNPGELPETEVERQLARQRLFAALDVLPDEQRDVFLLREEAGLGLDEIAFVTGSNRETAKSRLRYAVRKLRAAVDEPVGTS